MARPSSPLRLSVVVPARGEGDEPAPLLAELERAPEVLEIWLVEAPDDPGPVPISLVPTAKVRRVSAREVGRAAQMNLGAELSRGELLLFLHADSRVDREALTALVAFFSTRPGAAAAFRFGFRESDPRLRLLGLLGRIAGAVSPYAFGDQGFAVRRGRFLADGGFPDVPILEDWIVVRRYRRSGGFELLEGGCRTSGRRFLERGVLRQLWQNVSLLYRFAEGVPLDRLADEYRRGPSRRGGSVGVLAACLLVGAALSAGADALGDGSPSTGTGPSTVPMRSDPVVPSNGTAPLAGTGARALAEGPAAEVEAAEDTPEAARPVRLWDAFDAVLGARVDDRGLVRYEGILEDPAFIRAWSALQAVTEAELRSWPEPEQLAFWINAYNLATLRLIGEHYPIHGRFPIDLFYPDKSILMIPGRWDNAYEVAGATRSLDSIEHEILRRQFEEPRIHFAIVCASLGCPVLRSEAFRGTELDVQLDEQAALYFRLPSGLRYDARPGKSRPRVELTKILDWFGDDFLRLPPDPAVEAVQEGSRGELVARVARWFPDEVRGALRSRRADFGWIDYDWSLNERPSGK
ncbi:MAG: DUF547 domain-containing protein [Candidatus Eisenbacteria bacterium]